MREAVQKIMQAFGQAADGHQRDDVVDATANLLLNALRQSHAKLPAAEEELEHLVANMKAALARDHYLPDGTRRERQVILPNLVSQLRARALN